MINLESFKHNLSILMNKIEEACKQSGRDPSGIKVLPVTKTLPAEVYAYVQEAGLLAVGENRVQEFKDKEAMLRENNLQCELIGHLQTNKAKLAVSLFDRIQSVDSLKLLKQLSLHAGDQGKQLTILIQVNAGKDPAKFGCTEETVSPLVEFALGDENLVLEGLMTIAPYSEDLSVATKAFESLRSLRGQLEEEFSCQLLELSMGMSHDCVAAIKAGSTQLRIGSALFGARE